MRRTLSCLALFAAAFVLAGCSSTRMLSSEKAAEVGPVDLQGQKVMAWVIDPREEIRDRAETALAAELSKRGMEGIAAHTVVPAAVRADQAQAKAAVHASGALALVTTRLIATEEKQQYVPAVYDRDVDLYGAGWMVTHERGYYDSYGIFTIETRCFRVADEKLLWTGTSETVDPADLNALVKSLVKEAGKVMARQGLVKKK